MSTEETVRCDGCGVDVTTERYTQVMTQEYGTGGYSPQGTHDLCPACVADIIAALRTKVTVRR